MNRGRRSMRGISVGGIFTFDGIQDVEAKSIFADILLTRY